MKKTSLSFLVTLLVVFDMLEYYAKLLCLSVVPEPAKLDYDVQDKDGICYIRFKTGREETGKAKLRKPEILDIFNEYLIDRLHNYEILKPYFGLPYLAEPLYVDSINACNREVLDFSIIVVDCEAACNMVPTKYKRQISDAERVPGEQLQLAGELIEALERNHVCGIKTPHELSDMIPMGHRTIEGDSFYTFYIEKVEERTLSIVNAVSLRDRISDAILKTADQIYGEIYAFGELPDTFNELYKTYPLTMHGYRCVCIEDINSKVVKATFRIRKEGRRYE